MRLHSGLSIAAIAVAVALSAGDAAADGGSRSDPNPTVERPVNPDYAAGRQAVEGGHYQRGIEHLKRAVAVEPDNADALNFLGYGYRKLGDFTQSFDWYQKALAVDPAHRGAHEYLGELYLEMGEPAKAEAELAKLDRICFFGCDEYSDLKQAIEDYRAGRRTSGAGR
jgi:tetratricopeptide (TPR) repeat protein